MPYYDSETINKVKKIDALTYLMNYEPENVVQISRGTFSTKEHDSLKLSNGLWYWFSKSIGGKNALDYLMIVKEKSFLEAVGILLKKEIEITNNTSDNYHKPSGELVIPIPYKNNNRAIKYLLNRGIDLDIIRECISKNYIYEDENHNVVFVGYNSSGKMKYCFLRGTYSKRFMKESYGSDKAFSFRLESENRSDTVHLFESVIDLLSYATLNKDTYYNDNLLSLAGVYRPAKNSSESKLPMVLRLYFYLHPEIKKVCFHLDNDKVGREATFALMNLLKSKYIVIDEPPKIGKDFNDFLLYRKQNYFKKKTEKER